MRHLLGYIHLNPLDIEFSGWEKSINRGLRRDWKNFLKDYKYSSYQDFMSMGRIEDKILNRKSFPDYFKEKNSFEDFVDDYISFNQEKSS